VTRVVDTAVLPRRLVLDSSSGSVAPSMNTSISPERANGAGAGLVPEPATVLGKWVK